MNLNDSPHVHVNTSIKTRTTRARTAPAEVLFVTIRWWESATAR